MVDIDLVNWSRAQFALTAMYHRLFVPLTLGMIYILAIINTIYYVNRTEFWEKIIRFWTRIFAINFAVGVATGIILEFEFGTNWSNYAWFVGDIFGAPLMLEGISAFILEATFLAVMLLGWGKVSKGFYLASSWIVAIGGSLSATWILVANAWMQHPVGMYFNPDTMRNEMLNFWEVFFNPVAIVKYSHTMMSGFTLSSVVIIGISCWYLLKNREKEFAYMSIKIASIFGFFGVLLTVITGDLSGEEVAHYQPMKLAAIEAHYYGEDVSGFNLVAWFGDKDKDGMNEIKWKIYIPNALNLIVHKDTDTFIPGIKDLLYGNKEHGIIGAIDRIDNGKIAIQALADYKIAKQSGDEKESDKQLALFKKHQKDFGYGYFEKDNLGELVPNIPFLFYAFRYMVGMGFFVLFVYIPVIFYLSKTRKLEKYRMLLRFAILMIPLIYICSELGWVVSEVGRQPWVVYEMLPTKIGVSSTDTFVVKSTFFGFLAIFTILFIAAMKIVFAEIRKGPGIDRIQKK